MEKYLNTVVEVFVTTQIVRHCSVNYALCSLCSLECLLLLFIISVNRVICDKLLLKWLTNYLFKIKFLFYIPNIASNSNNYPTLLLRVLNYFHSFVKFVTCWPCCNQTWARFSHGIMQQKCTDISDSCSCAC